MQNLPPPRPRWRNCWRRTGTSRLACFRWARPSQGDNRYNDQLPNDQTQAFRQQLRAFYQKYQTQLRKTDRKALNANDQTSYDILDYDLGMSLAGLQRTSWMMPFSQNGGLPSALGQLGAGTGSQPFKTEQDYANWLRRVAGFPVWADSAIANFRRGMRAGVVLPKALVVKMIPQLESFVTDDVTKSLFYGPVAKFPAGVPASAQPALVASYRQAIATQLVPSYRKLADFLKTEYLPAARTSSGIGACRAAPNCTPSPCATTPPRPARPRKSTQPGWPKWRASVPRWSSSSSR